MEIRFAQIQDVPGILELLKQVGKVHHNLRPDLFRENAQKYSASGVLALLEDFDTPIFVAVENEKVLGYCFCQLQRVEKDPVLVDRESLYIDDLCVEETCRGQGIATALYRHTVAWAKQRGFSHISLNVWCGNAGAMAFYEAMGMRPRHIMMEQSLEEV
jgi:ribosomal protein S18 acetylase RimI-like enzyme